jgi:hypothetical protein
MSLKDLASQAGVTSPKEGAPAAATADTEAPAKKTVGDLAKPKAKAKKATRPRAIVDDAWIKGLVEKANEKFGEKDEFDGAKVDFTIAKSKGRFVSLTPKLIYPDGTAKSAGPKKRIGFCTNQEWDGWFEKLGNALTTAHTAERKAGTARKSSGQWATFAVPVREALGQDIKVKSIAKKLSIKDPNGNRVTLKREGDEALVSTASGSPAFILKVLNTVSGIQFPAEAA